MSYPRDMRYYEDLQLGDKFNTADYVMTAAEIAAFAQQYDPQPFHTDAVAARATFFGQLVASGWHTAAVSMRLMVQGEMALDGGGRWPRHGKSTLAPASLAWRSLTSGD